METVTQHTPDASVATGPARIALIGLGGAAQRILLPALKTLPDVRLVAACDLDPATRDRMATRWAIGRTYAGPEEMLREERPDVAVIATPPLTHGDLCLLALEHGCHVFCEKPFMASIEDADRVIGAAARARRVIAVNNQYYEMPIYREVKRVLASGASGPLYRIGVWQRMYLLPRQEGGWKAALQPRRVLYEFGTHVLDLICQFFEAYPVAVSARIPKVRQDIDADVVVLMRLDFPGERVADLYINRISHAPKNYIDMRLDCEKASLRTSQGRVGRLELGWNSVLKRPRLVLSLATGGMVRWESEGKSRLLMRQSHSALYHAAAGHFSRFLAAVRNGGEPPVSARHAREVLRIVFAGYQSAARDGELVKLGTDQAMGARDPAAAEASGTPT